MCTQCVDRPTAGIKESIFFIRRPVKLIETERRERIRQDSRALSYIVNSQGIRSPLMNDELSDNEYRVWQCVIDLPLQ